MFDQHINNLILIIWLFAHVIFVFRLEWEWMPDALPFHLIQYTQRLTSLCVLCTCTIAKHTDFIGSLECFAFEKHIHVWMSEKNTCKWVHNECSTTWRQTDQCCCRGAIFAIATTAIANEIRSINDTLSSVLIHYLDINCILFSPRFFPRCRSSQKHIAAVLSILRAVQIAKWLNMPSFFVTAAIERNYNLFPIVYNTPIYSMMIDSKTHELIISGEKSEC